MDPDGYDPIELEMYLVEVDPKADFTAKEIDGIDETALKCFKKDFINNGGTVAINFQFPDPTMVLFIIGTYQMKIDKPVCSGDTVSVGNKIKTCKDQTGSSCKHKDGVLVVAPAENPNP